MVRSPAQGPSIADRVRVDRVIASTSGVTSSLATEMTSGAAVLIKEYAHATARPFPPADPKRSVWTRLLLPSQVESTDGLVRILRPYVEGQPLDDAMADGPLSVAQAIGVGLDLLRALDTLHGLGLVHGAIKPSNVIVGPDGRAWLVDPAVSDPASGSAPHAGTPSLETARYFSPEQSGVLNGPVDGRSDLYTVGVILFECLVGRPLHQATDTGELLRAQVLEPSSSIRGAGVAGPRMLDEIVERLLRRDPRDRYATAAGALQDLRELERSLDRGDHDPALVIGKGDVRTTLTEPGLAGRTEELTRIADLLERATTGRGVLVRLQAGSGDGKTRILREIALSSAQRGARVFRAEAHELEAPRPFAMLEDLAASVLGSASEDPSYADHLTRTLRPWAQELLVVLPSLAGLLDAGERRGSARSSESRLQEALAAFFDALGTPSRPAVLLLDDCQWADELSLAVVARWSADPRPGRSVTVVAAIRTEEIVSDRGATIWTKARTIELGPLGETETRDLVSSMAGRVPDEAIAVIARLARGRPFFVTSILHGMVESAALRPGSFGWDMDPDALAALASSGHAATIVTRRLGRLPDGTLALLSAAAILGRHASVAESAALAQADAAQVDGLLEEARRAGLIWLTERRDGLSFIHDKVREGALRRLDDDERRALHRRAAGLIERTRPDDVFDLAYHLDEAGACDQAFPAAIEAAAIARARQSLESTETMLRIAARGVAGGDAAWRARVADELGEVLMLRGAYEESGRWLEEARALAPPGTQAAEIAGRIGELAFKRGDVRTAAEALERALRMIGRRVPRHTAILLPMLVWEILVQALHTAFPTVFVGRRRLDRADADLLASRFHGRLGYAWWFERGKIATLWTHLRSLDLAERYPPGPELAQAYSEHAPAMMLIPLHRRGVRYAQRSHAIRVRLGDLWGQGQSLHFWGAGLYAASAFQASLDRMLEAQELLERTGDRWELNNCRLQIAMARYRLGDLAGAVEASTAARRAGLEIGDAQARGIGLEGWAKATDGLIPEQVIRAELERSSEDVLTVASVMQADGVRLLGAGDILGAVAAFEESQGLFRQAGMKNAGVGPVRPWLLTALRRAAEATPVVDRRRRAALLRRARSVARQAGRRARFYRNDLPHVLRERAHLAALAGRRHRAHRLFGRSIDVAIEQGARAEVLRGRIARGQVGPAFGWAADVEDGARAERELERLIAATGQTPPSPPPSTLSLADRFETVLVHGRRIASALRAEDVESAALEAAGALFRAERSRVLRVAGGRELYDSVTRELVDHPVARLSIEASRAVSSSDEQEGSALAAPILVRGRPVACILSTHAEVSSLFGEAEERLIEFVCTLAGAALENADGFEEVRSLTRTLERRVLERTTELARSNQALEESLVQLERANAELRELDRMKDDFVSMVSHELRTPLTSVLGFSSTLLAIPDEIPAEEMRSSLQVIERQSRRLSRLVENLLELSRLDQAALQVSMASHEVQVLLQRAIEELTELDVPVAVDCPPGTRILVDPDCFTQIMINLLSNAGRHGRPPYGIEVIERGGFVEVAVTDRGDGVPVDFVDRLFERFQQAETGPGRVGMGLGLSIVASLARSMGGDARYEPNEPSGARFVLRFHATR